MSSTSQKHLNFVAEPMGEKPVSDLAGVGDVLGKRLCESGFDKVSTFYLKETSKSYWNLNIMLGYVNNNIKMPAFILCCVSIPIACECFVFDFFFHLYPFQAYTVLGQYLVLKKDSELFKEWMKEVCQANSKQAADCYQCLNDWCDEFL